jgi:hypothetical protein
MADAPRSPLAPIEGLSFEICVGIGAVFGLLMAGLAWGLGPMQLHGAAGTPGATAMAGQTPGGSTKTASAEDGDGDGGAGRDGGAEA